MTLRSERDPLSTGAVPLGCQQDGSRLARFVGFIIVLPPSIVITAIALRGR